MGVFKPAALLDIYVSHVCDLPPSLAFDLVSQYFEVSAGSSRLRMVAARHPTRTIALTDGKANSPLRRFRGELRIARAGRGTVLILDGSYERPGLFGRLMGMIAARAMLREIVCYVASVAPAGSGVSAASPREKNLY